MRLLGLLQGMSTSFDLAKKAFVPEFIFCQPEGLLGFFLGLRFHLGSWNAGIFLACLGSSEIRLSMTSFFLAKGLRLENLKPSSAWASEENSREKQKADKTSRFNFTATAPSAS